jgi:hypothetical protein
MDTHTGDGAILGPERAGLRRGRLGQANNLVPLKTDILLKLVWPRTGLVKYSGGTY